MARVRFTRHLHRFFPALEKHQPLEMQAANVGDLVQSLNDRFEGLASYLINDDGSLRKHVVIFVNTKPIVDRRQLSDALQTDSDVMIMQALSGG